MNTYETLQTLTGPNREVDALIAMLFEPESEDGTYFRAPFISEISDKDCVDGQYWKCAISGRSLRTAPEYTANLNTVIELIKREMPGYGWRMTGGFHVFTEGILFPPGDFEPDIIGKHDLPAVALLMALMAAKGFKP